MTIQETITSALETTEKVYVLYLDVAKAFDSIWMNGLFYRLRELVIRGMTWHLLLKTYLDFKSCVRIQNKLPEWYHMRGGIHQAGYLSLIKHIAFIDSLIIPSINLIS